MQGIQAFCVGEGWFAGIHRVHETCDLESSARNQQQPSHKSPLLSFFVLLMIAIRIVFVRFLRKGARRLCAASAHAADEMRLCACAHPPATPQTKNQPGYYTNLTPENQQKKLSRRRVGIFP